MSFLALLFLLRPFQLELPVHFTSAPDEATKWRYEYFVNQIHEMDEFVEDLTTTLSDYDERVILVMYGDHIPAHLSLVFWRG